jgi:hypothetical protein
MEPTHQALSHPLADLAAYIDAIPSAITIENVEFSVHQTTIFNQEMHMAEIQAQFGVNDAKYNQLLQVVGQYFTEGTQQLSGFEHKIANGCRQLCETVHKMGGTQADFKEAMFALAVKCQGTAGTTNANQATIQ